MFVSVCCVLSRCFSLVRVDVDRRCLMFVVGVLRVNRCSCCGVLWLSVDDICCSLMLFWFVVCCSPFAAAVCGRVGALVCSLCVVVVCCRCVSLYAVGCLLLCVVRSCLTCTIVVDAVYSCVVGRCVLLLCIDGWLRLLFVVDDCCCLLVLLDVVRCGWCCGRC